MKNFSTEIYKEALGKLTFPDNGNFSCVNEAYFDLTSKIFDAANKVAPTKSIRIKSNTNSRRDTIQRSKKCCASFY